MAEYHKSCENILDIIINLTIIEECLPHRQFFVIGAKPFILIFSVSHTICKSNVSGTTGLKSQEFRGTIYLVDPSWLGREGSHDISSKYKIIVYFARHFNIWSGRLQRPHPKQSVAPSNMHIWHWKFRRPPESQLLNSYFCVLVLHLHCRGMPYDCAMFPYIQKVKMSADFAFQSKIICGKKYVNSHKKVLRKS